MKTQYALIAAPALLIFGAFAGRELFPVIAPLEEVEPVSLSTRGKRKPIRVTRAPESHPAASPTDLTDFLDLIDTQDPFTTSTRLRAALGDLGPGTLEGLLLEITGKANSDARSHTLRASLLNHLVAKDPFYALEMLLNMEDAGFRNSMLGTVMRGAARLDLEAARQVLATIDDPQLRQFAETALVNSDTDASSEDLVALLQSSKNAPQFSGNFLHHYGWGNQFQSWHSGNYYHDYSAQASGVLVKLAQQDLGAAEAYAKGLKTAHERSSAFMQIANGLAQTDPDLALDWARNTENPFTRNQALSSVIGIIATQNPSRAISLLDDIDSPSHRDGLISTIASTWASKDSHAALAWIKSLPTSKASVNATSSVATRMGLTDPLGAIAVIENLPGQAGRNYLPNIVSQWAQRDFESARNWMTSQDDPQTIHQVISNILPQWIQKNPTEAANFIIERSENGANSNLTNQLATIASSWASRDQTAALNWAKSLENEASRIVALQGVYQSWTSSNPAEAARHLTTITNSNERKGLLSQIASNWIGQDPQAAKDWLQTLPHDERFNAAGATISSLSHSSPRLAAEILDNMVTQAAGNEDSLRKINNHASNIASNWSNHAPADAAEWAAGITSEGAQANAYRNIASNWAQFDPPAAASWIDTLPPGNPRDKATERLVDQIKTRDPIAAFDWANSINGDSQRYSSVRDVVNQWKQNDPEAARQAVQNAAITDSQREQLLRQIQ